MARRNSSPLTITLPEGQKAFVEERVRVGRFASASEVVRAGLRALEREEAHLDEWMRQKVDEALDDPRPDIPADEVFAELRARNAALAAREDPQD
jgi:antitoxin ParD1/3/4